MKLSNILKYCCLIFLFSVPVLAQGTYESFSDGVNVTASINEDHFSTMTIVPNSIEINEWATVVVQISDGHGNFLPDRKIDLDWVPSLIYTPPTVLTNANGIVEIPVSSNIPATYDLCAMDITDPDLEIMIVDCKVLYVTPVPIPVMISEPSYTKGNSNTVFWTNMGSKYQYVVEVSLNSDFSTVLNSSGWISGTMFEFSNLQNNSMYFYRVRARNLSGGVSGWSNTVFSVQDSLAPTISVISLPNVDDITTVEWESNYELTFSYSVVDNVGVDSAELLCVDRSGAKRVCGNTVKNGSLYTTTVRLGDLDKDRMIYLFTEYGFCIRVIDTVGNERELCGIDIEIEQGEGYVPPDEERPKPPPPVEVIRKVINDTVNDVVEIFDGAFGKIPSDGLNAINTSTALVSVGVGLSALLGGLLYIPIYLFELLLALITWLGLRKKGKTCGYVYDSKTKEALSQVIVRVYNESNSLVWTDVTNSRGFFDLKLDDGKYSIKVMKHGYLFPSKIIFGNSDYPLDNVYHGSVFEIVNDEMPNFSIPMDSEELSKFDIFRLAWGNRLRVAWKVLSVAIFLFGLSFCSYVYFKDQSLLNFILLLLYLPISVIVIRGLFKRGLKFGVVYDIDGNFLPSINIGLREMEFNRILYKRVTDSRGRYRFVVERGVYNIEILDPEYIIGEIKEKKVVKLTDDSQLIAFDVVVNSVEK